MRNFNKKILFALLIVFIAPLVCAETKQMNSYYPSPFGHYDRLRLVPRTTFPTCATAFVGTLFYDKNTKSIRVCQDDDTWTPLSGVWTQEIISPSEAIIYLTETNTRKFNVGIGPWMDNPQYPLEVKPWADFVYRFSDDGSGNMTISASDDSGNLINSAIIAEDITFNTPGFLDTLVVTLFGVGIGGIDVASKIPGAVLEVEGPTVLNSWSADLSGTDLSFLQGTNKFLIGRNRSSDGEVDFIANRGNASQGGYTFFDYDNVGIERLLLRIHSDGRVGIGAENNTRYSVHIQHPGGTGLTDPTKVILENSTAQGSAHLVLAENTGANQDGFRIKYFSSTNGVDNFLQFNSFTNASPIGVNVMSLDRNSRFVGIGVDDPQSNLHLRSTSSIELKIDADIDNINNNDHASLILRQDNNLVRSSLDFSFFNTLTLKSIRNSNMIFGTRNLERMRILSSNGRIGIGIAPNNNYRLNVGGGDFNLRNLANSGYYDQHICQAGSCPSDRSLKEDVQPLSKSLDKIDQLKPVNFEYIDPSYGPGKQTALIAQDVEEVYPEWVTEDEDGIKRVRYGMQISMHLIQAIKELAVENEELKKELETLKAQIN